MDIKCLSNRETKSVIAVCRLCISYTECSYSIDYLSPYLDDVLPTLDLTLTNNPVVCVNCVNLLTTTLDFKTKCIETERRIKEHYNKTKNKVNLFSLVEGRESCDNISNFPNPIAMSVNIADDTIKVEELDLPFIEEQQSIETNAPENSFKLISMAKNDNYKSIFIKKEQGPLKLEDSKENRCKSFNETREEDPEIDKKMGTSYKINFKECELPVDSSIHDVSNVVEIVESDIGSDINMSWSDDEDFEIFKEFCCKTQDNESDAVEPSASIVVIQNVEEIDHIASGSESRDSDMVFIEHCDNHNTSKGTYKHKSVTGSEIVTEEVKASLPFKSPQPDSVLSMSKDLKAANQNNSSRINLYKRLKNKQFSCVLCSKTFHQKLHLDGHLLNKHKNISDIEKRVQSKIHFCHYCLYRTINNHSLARHLAKKHKKMSNQYQIKFKKFSCGHCEYATDNKGNLMTHERRHSSIKAFQCYFCESAFHQKGNLDTHFLKCHASTMNAGKSEKVFKSLIVPKKES